ncbi:MAG: nuclear transport factor 2 family protein [Ectothiorhodospiraceae bacterium AqS1]|nr:nuclear transport factor 2 family protein [Ectothiorhodospiraceae bacterium AqS1]
MKYLIAMIFLVATLAVAEDDLPTAIACYQESANAKDIEAYMACFKEDAEMIDVSRTFNGHEAIRAWAVREVIGSGQTFRHRKILDASQGYAKTEVKWLTWIVHYSYWWDEDGKITRMSLQYAD